VSAPRLRALVLALLLGRAADLIAAAPETVELASPRQVVRIALTGGLPVEWLACAVDCRRGDGRSQRLLGAGEGTLTWAADGGTAAALGRLQYEAQFSETAAARSVVLTARAGPEGLRLVQRYELARGDHTLRARLELPPGAGLALTTGPGFAPEPLPGFGAAFTDVEAVRIGADGQETIGTVGPQTLAVPADAWVGIRSRFWAWLAQPVAGVTAVAAPSTVTGGPQLAWRGPGERLELVFYAGPVEWKSLRVVSGDLPRMLFAALWEPLRWLSFGLLLLLAFIGRWVEGAGLAIILLSLAVKILLWPLTRIAERWQQDVNRIQGRLQPRIAEVKRQYRGEEAHNRTLQVYREEGVHPLFTLKSLAGFAIQVPMFIAAFDMLAENFALSGARFLWVADLAAPDRFLALPVTLPFFGAHLNLLPVVMTLLTIVAAIVQRDASLTPLLRKRQQRQLYLMAGGFFLLFYTFPAGMVLYWTANNFWHLVKVAGSGYLARRARQRSPAT
jgi:YidC/Oxa1 family membrane protein insertase